MIRLFKLELNYFTLSFSLTGKSATRIYLDGLKLPRTQPPMEIFLQECALIRRLLETGDQMKRTGLFDLLVSDNSSMLSERWILKLL